MGWSTKQPKGPHYHQASPTMKLTQQNRGLQVRHSVFTWGIPHSQKPAVEESRGQVWRGVTSGGYKIPGNLTLKLVQWRHQN